MGWLNTEILNNSPEKDFIHIHRLYMNIARLQDAIERALYTQSQEIKLLREENSNFKSGSYKHSLLLHHLFCRHQLHLDLFVLPKQKDEYV